MTVWFITGCSSGFGKEIALHALKRGDKVVATARNPSTLQELESNGAVIMAFDVTASDDEIKSKIEEVIRKTGTIDILVNNAGYALQGAVEECSREEVFRQYNTNVFGVIAVTKTVLPYMRKHRSGVIANIGSLGGWVGAPASSMYFGTKFALAGLSQSLRKEVEHLGIEVTCIEPGMFRTSFGNGRNVAENKIEDYKSITKPRYEFLDMMNGKQPGDPSKAGKFIVEALTKSGRCEGKTLPGRMPLGKDAVNSVKNAIDASKAEVEAWEELTTPMDFTE